MKSFRRLVAVVVLVALSVISSGARAQQGPPPSAPPAGEPPPGYAPQPGYPPSGYPQYPNEPPGYAPPPGYRPAPRGPNGLGLLITGAILLPIGFIFTVASVYPALDGYDLLPGSTPGYSSSDLRDQRTGLALFSVGFVFATAGIVLLAIGAGQRQRWLRARGVALTATGLGFRF